ncbi:MAG: GNAT family N-acetyltransferase [Candidatus Cloacimonetes bacterium]|nr:GNAT family N-acetyltransferase [Candidatus Cloacimonadota bacterium]
MRYYKKLIGEKCYLSPINIDDAEKYCEWINDLEMTQYTSLAIQQIGLSKEIEILNGMIKRGSPSFAIIDKSKNKLIGNCSLFNINKLYQTAELGIIIGDKDYWGKGFGTEAITLILDYGFNILNFHNIMLELFSFNERALKSYKKVGFKIIGRRREAILIAGKRVDMIYMDILSEEFKSVFVEKKLMQ